MNISAISLSLTRPGGGLVAPLTPEQQVAALFAAGEQGAWYDPSDYTTMFNEASGATPITTVEQPVGLILDKRKGLALGAELNDGLGDAGNWTALGTNTVGESGDEITITYVDNAAGATAAFSAAAGLSTNLTVAAWYKVTGEAKVNTGSVTIRVSAATTFDSVAITSTSFVPFTIYFPASNATTNTLTFTGMGSGETITVRSISVKLLDGNHAYQTTSAARPVLRSRYNLLTYSEQFDNGVWSKSGLLAFGSGSTANATTAPDGTITADLLCIASGSGVKELYQQLSASAVAGVTYTMSLYAKAGTNSFFQLFFSSSAFGSGAWANFDVSGSGAMGTVGTSVNTGLPGSNVATISSVGNGWFRCVLTAACTTSGTYWHDLCVVSSASATRAQSFASAAGTETMYFWGAQMNLGSTATAYQRIAAAPTVSSTPTYATTSTMGGEVFRPYLWFDGADVLQTSAWATPTTDKAIMCSGESRLADSNFQFLCEYSANVTTNNGAFSFLPDDDPQQPMSAGCRGASAFAISLTTNRTGPTPRLVSAAYDLAASTAAAAVDIRIDKVASDDSSSGSAPGGGNFGSYSFFFGARTNLPTSTTIFGLNGNVWGMVVRMAATSAAQLESVENYMASKMGVTL